MSVHQHHQCEQCGYDLARQTPIHCPKCGFLAHRYTQRVREVIAVANKHAIDMFSGKRENQRLARWWQPCTISTPAIYPFHLLLGLATGPSGVAQHVLVRSSVHLDSLVRAIEVRSPRIKRHNLSNVAKLRLHASSGMAVKAVSIMIF